MMTINNFGPNVSQGLTRAQLLQRELLDVSVEMEKSRGVMRSVISLLAQMKVAALEKKYKNLRVYHDRYEPGNISHGFEYVCGMDDIRITLRWWVKALPEFGDVSKAEKVRLKRYESRAYCYSAAREYVRQCPSLWKDPRLPYGSIAWTFSLDDIISPDFLTGGLSVDKSGNSYYTIILNPA